MNDTTLLHCRNPFEDGCRGNHRIDSSLSHRARDKEERLVT